MIESLLEQYPTDMVLKGGLHCTVRPLDSTDEKRLLEFFQAMPERERMFIKHRVTDTEVIHAWCSEIDYGHNLPLLALIGEKIVGVATLHQQLGGWKRHIGRISVLVHPEFRGHGIARTLVNELMEIARGVGLKKAEAEFLAEQSAALRTFSMLGFQTLLHLEEYVQDMQGISHDYILMGVDLKTDEEYAGMG